MRATNNSHLVSLALRLVHARSPEEVLTEARDVLSATFGGAVWAIYDRITPQCFRVTTQTGVGYDSLQELMTLVCGLESRLVIDDDLVACEALGAPCWQVSTTEESGRLDVDLVIAAWPKLGHTGEEDLQLREVTALISGALKQARELDAYRVKSIFDELTSILNRRGIHEALGREQLRSERYGTTLAVLFVDVNKFKPINDTYGHKVGDEALRLVATTLQATARASDIVGRIAGDEFLVILTDVDAVGAERAAGRMMEAVEQARLMVGDTRVELSISVGAALHGAGMGTEALIERADSAMYRTKRGESARSELASSLASRRVIDRIVEQPMRVA
ncbi:MAG: GGDEF domain-containing protein [Myxococcota bacterium]|nr:GGDEF domain-containing protein [Myxococcota bacterium]